MLRKRTAGTSLIELLVVIVIFLIGILGVIQVFPGGLQALRTTRNNSIATELARKEMERVKGRADQLPDLILPVTYVFGGPGISILADTNRDNRNLGLAGTTIDQNGDVLDAANNVLGKWGLLSGANVMRRVMGEGGRVPGPRNVGGQIGGLMILQFAPIVPSGVYNSLLRVYGNDMVRRYGDPPPGAFTRNYEFYVSDEDDNGNTSDTFFLPVIPLPPSVTESPYRLSFSFYVDNGGTVQLREVVDIDPATVRAALVTAVNHPGYWTIDIQALLTSAGLLTGVTYIGIEDETLKCQRNFYQVAGPFSANPYEYQLLDANLGVLLFNPAGYNYYERRQNGQRLPLVSRVNYDVLDWRIIREEFRAPTNYPFQLKLALNSLMVKSMPGPDGRTYNGMDFPVSDGAGGTQSLDVVLIDEDSGSVLLHDPTNPRDPTIPVTTSNDYMAVDPTRSSYVVDKSLGLIRLLDFDENPANGLQVRLIYPGTSAPVTVTIDGRKLLALYQARSEWAVQVMKAPNVFQIIFGVPGVGQCYVGTSSINTGGDGRRIYFPGMDVGKKVSIGEIWYTNPSGRQVLRDQDFVITGTPSDPLGVPYIDIRTVDANALSFDFSNGYAVRTVKGASISARVLWNPDSFRLTNDNTANLNAFEQWGRGWRRTTVENYLERGSN